MGEKELRAISFSMYIKKILNNKSGTNGIIDNTKALEKVSFTDEGMREGLKFKPRPSDIIVAGTTKSGTTWTQQIVHQLKSGGDMNFREITYVVPLLEYAHDLGMNLDDEQQFYPRCFKTHVMSEWCPKGGKYIVVIREPCAVANSSFNFYNPLLFQPGKESRNTFIFDYFLNEYSHYYEHLISWWKQRNNPNVMFLFYEEMIANHERSVRAIANFMGIADEEKIFTAVQYSKFDFMKKNVHKFDTNYLFKDKNANSPVYAKVATGSPDKALSILGDDEKEAIQARWEKTVFKKTGCKTYNEFKQCLRNEKPLITADN